MNRHGDKQASKLHAHAVCKPGAVCDPASDPYLVEVPQADVPARSALAFGETEGVLSSLVRLVGQRDRHTAGHCERLVYSGVALGVAMRLDNGSRELVRQRYGANRKQITTYAPVRSEGVQQQ